MCTACLGGSRSQRRQLRPGNCRPARCFDRGARYLWPLQSARDRQNEPGVEYCAARRLLGRRGHCAAGLRGHPARVQLGGTRSGCSADLHRAAAPLPPPPPPPPLMLLPAVHGATHRHQLQAESWDVERKADDSPLTRADREANAVICEGLARVGACDLGGQQLQAALCVQAAAWHLELSDCKYNHVSFAFLCAAPHIPIVSEENRQVAYDTRKVRRSWPCPAHQPPGFIHLLIRY